MAKLLHGLGTWWICIGGCALFSLGWMLFAIWGGINSKHSNHTDFTDANNFYQIRTDREYHGEE